MQKHVCDLLLVSNTNLIQSHTVSNLQRIIGQIFAVDSL